MMTPSRISPPDTGHMPDLLPSRRTHLACRRRCPVPSQESQGACPQKKKKNDIVARAAGLGRPEGRDREPFENVPRGRLPAASASASVGAPQTRRHATPHVRSAARGRGGGTRKRPATGGTARCGGGRPSYGPRRCPRCCAGAGAGAGGRRAAGQRGGWRPRAGGPPTNVDASTGSRFSVAGAGHVW